MKKIILFMASLLMMTSVVFAQQSKTNESTAELFTNDVDAYMNVNDWATVNPEKIFGFVGYTDLSTAAINIGLAGKTSNLYIGSYFGGKLPRLEREKNSSQSSIKWLSGEIFGNMIFGFNNMGIQTRFNFKPTELSTVKTKSPEVKTVKSNFSLTPGLSFGINLNGANDRVYKVWVDFDFVANIDKTKEVSSGSSTTTASNTYDLNLGAGVAFDISKKGMATHSIAIGTDVDLKKLGTNALQMDLPINVDYTAGFAFTDAFELKVGTGAEFLMKYNSGTEIFNFNVTPSLKTGFVWMAVPEKFALNFGTEVALLSPFKFTKNGDAINWNFDTVQGKLTAKSGFTWNITKNVALDGNLNIVDLVIGDSFQSSITSLDSLFDETLTLQVSFKY